MKFLSFFLSIIFVSCSASTKQKADTQPVKQTIVPQFDADSAYNYVHTQVNFGARVPNSKAHQSCLVYLVNEMKRFGAQVIEQKADLKAFDGTVLHATNIIASYQPELKSRVLLCAHWDCRPFCDHDPDPANYHKPVTGANDAASGVGVLMEVARQIQKEHPQIGIDILFLDAEDYGAPDFYQGHKDEDSWCLGTQYWAKNPHVAGYKARYGILLDMVGAPGATFYKEQVSLMYAPDIVEKVWNKAQEMGFSAYFINQQGGAITDDHLYINRLAKIPCIDIIHTDLQSSTGFASYWHTTHDTMQTIDKNTLKVVGQTLLGVIYNEQ